MVMAGGGFRFGCYLGMHAAAEEEGLAPDLLIGACGGAIAAAVIHALPDKDARMAWLTSPQLYEFQRAITSSPQAVWWRVLPNLLKRALWPQSSACMRASALSEGMFALPPLPVLPATTGEGPDVAIIGARVSPCAEKTSGHANAKCRLHETVFGPTRVARLLNGHKTWAAQLANSTVDAVLDCNTGMRLSDAVRISIADPYYFSLVEAQSQKWSGGLVDLFPIEIAQALAERVWMERKRPFNVWYAQPAVRAVYGVEGNARRQQAQAQSADVWIDTQDVSRVLQQETTGKGVDVRSGRIVLRPAENHAAFARQMTSQWHYGRERALRALAVADRSRA